MTVLLADDEAIALKMLQKLVKWEELGLTLEGTARSGDELLELMEKIRPDIVVTDIMMPGKTGLEIIRVAREKGLQAHFLITSAYADFSYAQTAIRLGVRDYLEKPIDGAELNSTLRKIVSELSGPAAGKEDVSAVVRSVKNYIESHYAEKITLESVAGEVFVSPNYLSGLFKKELGTGFSDYLTEVRLRKAKDLLADVKLSVEEVSLRSGYKDPRYFCSVFHRRTGMSPSEYRRSAGNGVM